MVQSKTVPYQCSKLGRTAMVIIERDSRKSAENIVTLDETYFKDCQNINDCGIVHPVTHSPD